MHDRGKVLRWLAQRCGLGAVTASLAASVALLSHALGNGISLGLGWVLVPWVAAGIFAPIGAIAGCLLGGLSLPLHWYLKRSGLSALSLATNRFSSSRTLVITTHVLVMGLFLSIGLMTVGFGLAVHSWNASRMTCSSG